MCRNVEHVQGTCFLWLQHALWLCEVAGVYSVSGLQDVCPALQELVVRSVATCVVCWVIGAVLVCVSCASLCLVLFRGFVFVLQGSTPSCVNRV